ncbi:MAG: hypothetical protein A3C12_00085 [Candidatus Sungbacteria bacterium RIFCSPHIGHO2_02_FULL_49_20]|uniref:Uncharacterized protein n=1 Tax=Candidatus Sungbacteria bacterium RIFCSPHIGHO2_02_FULL_49_20 TaxID=1802272 RepID=A0A1G2KSF6_9BACT|nr:MAG: hypothetical protein A3C12_00085 [Candidatus Sungbacteria bacterium RIFCSPHIGHO2_02_FULL_49_20]
MKRRFLILSILLAALSGLFILPLVWEPNVAKAGPATGGLIPFGGRILTSTPCDEGQWITVGPPRPGSFMLTAGSILYAWYQIYRPGAWAKGIARPITIPCTVPCPAGECTIGSGLQIDKVGTSLK